VLAANPPREAPGDPVAGSSSGLPAISRCARARGAGWLARPGRAGHPV